MSEVLRSCQRVLWLDGGNLAGYGPVEETVQRYLDFCIGVRRNISYIIGGLPNRVNVMTVLHEIGFEMICF